MAYRVKIVKIDDETNETEEICDRLLKNVTMIGDTDKGGFSQLIMNDNCLGIAAKIACSKELGRSARLATFLLKMKDDVDLESELIDLIKEGE